MSKTVSGMPRSDSRTRSRRGSCSRVVRWNAASCCGFSGSTSIFGSHGTCRRCQITSFVCLILFQAAAKVADVALDSRSCDQSVSPDEFG